MNKIETVRILDILKASYPAFYSKIPKSEIDTIVSVWQDSFADKPIELVATAVRSLIKVHSGYPPDIASIHTEIKSLTSAATGEPTDEELWLIYKKAVQGSGYCENETFDKLPPILQKYCGTARTLYEHAMMSLETFNTVLHGQFLKQLPVMRQKQEYHDSMSEPVRKAIADMAQRMALPPGEQAMTPQELNEKRNSLVMQLVEPIVNPVSEKKLEYVPISAEEKEKRKQELLNKLQKG